MAKYKYPVGYKFNNLTVLEFLGTFGKGRHGYYKCRCDCGKIVNVLTTHMLVQKSCGCLPREMKKL